MRSSIDDWELIVVGDACRDHTAQVVEAFGDPRIRFVNLERNHGEQSVPNNRGVELARADTIAFLNHDDLYFPDHLERSLAWLEETGADLAFSLIAAPQPQPPEELDAGGGAFEILGASPVAGYEPYVSAPASGWVFRREVAEQIGGWRSAWGLHTTASQDFLFRAWKAGYDLRAHPHLGVLALRSADRPGCYVEDQSAEAAWYADRIENDPRLREWILALASSSLAGRIARSRVRPRFPKRRQLLYRPSLWLGLDPRGVNAIFKYGGRGGLYRIVNGIRGLGENHGRDRRA